MSDLRSLSHEELLIFAERCAEALALVINTVECVSIDMSEGPTKGQQLPWYRAARRALGLEKRMSDQQKLSELRCSHCRTPIKQDEICRYFGTHVAHSESTCLEILHSKIEALETQLADAIRELDDARAETKIRTESLHTAVRLKLQAQSQRDALVKALEELVECVEDLDIGFAKNVDPNRWVIQATKPAREALFALERPAPLTPKSGDEYWKMVEETAKKVDKWPDWKKPAPGDGGKKGK